MGNQSTKDYKFAEKNKWRLHTWRVITRKLSQYPLGPISPKKAKGAYLPSKSDKDRDIACRKFGFSRHNLIPIERDQKTVKSLRRQNKTVLAGDAWESLTLIPPGELDFVHLDFCNGLTRANREGLDSFILAAPLTPAGVFSVNLLAGRDSRDFMFAEDAFQIPSEYKGHRGFLFILNMLLWDRERYQQCFNEEISDENVAQIAEWCEPQFASYRSRNLRMDSVIFKCWALTGHFIAKLSWDERKRKFGWTEEQGSKVRKMCTPWHNYKAIRTRRINGTLPPSPSK